MLDLAFGGRNVEVLINFRFFLMLSTHSEISKETTKRIKIEYLIFGPLKGKKIESGKRYKTKFHFINAILNHLSGKKLGIIPTFTK